MNPWDIVTAVSAVAAVAVAVWALLDSRKANRKASTAADRANEIAATLARIETDRHLADLTPEFEIVCQENYGINTLRLKVTMTGPPGLDRIDSLTLAINDDSDRRARGTRPGGPSAEEIERQIWSPYRLQPCAGPDGALADETGRVITYERPLPKGDPLVFLLEETNPPKWATWDTASWSETVGTVLRLTLTMTHADHGAWPVTAELELKKLMVRNGGPVKITVPGRR